MITITPQAAEQIVKSAHQAGLQEVCLRLAARLGKEGVIEYGMGYDDQVEGDTQIVTGTIKVVMSTSCIELLTGATLDYVEINPGELRFIFINPNDPSHKPLKSAR
jgi:iron-sulfur cluster assembly protein